MMHHAQIAQRAFNTPLMVDPAKALAFLSGLGPRITGQEITFHGVDADVSDQTAVSLPARASLFGNDLAQRHQRNGSQTVAAGRGDRLTQAAALATEAAVFRGTDDIAAGLADDLADPATAFHAFAAAPRGTTSPNRKGPQMTTTPTDAPNAAPVAAPPVAMPAGPVTPATAEPLASAAAPVATTMTADVIRAEAAEVAQVCAQAARLGVTIDAADAVTRGLKPEALRARVLADLAARSDAAGIIATAPAAASKESPIVAAAKKTATDAKR